MFQSPERRLIKLIEDLYRFI